MNHLSFFFKRLFKNEDFLILKLISHNLIVDCQGFDGPSLSGPVLQCYGLVQHENMPGQFWFNRLVFLTQHVTAPNPIRAIMGQFKSGLDRLLVNLPV